MLLNVTVWTYNMFGTRNPVRKIWKIRSVAYYLSEDGETYVGKNSPDHPPPLPKLTI